MATKQRIGVKLRDTLGSKSNNESADLVGLTERFHVMKKKMGMLGAALRRHHQMIQEMTKSRTAIATHVSSLTDGTPMHTCGGALGNQDTPTSYAAIHQKLSTQVMGYADKYNTFVVEYVVEWDRVVTTRITAGLKTTDNLRRDLDHYQKKVEDIRSSANKSLAKGKLLDDKTQDKLKRNEEKFKSAKDIYDKAARDMCMILEEITERAWKDLHPILVKMAQFDMTLANDEAKALSNLESVVTTLKGLSMKYDLKPSGRLKELTSQEASAIYTGNQGGNMRLENGDVSPIMGGVGGMGLNSNQDDYDYDSESLPPGSVAPQGLGGLPVMIKDDPPASSREIVSSPSSGNSWASKSMSTSEMLTVSKSSAPAPTLDQVRGSFQERAISTSSLGSYGSSSGFNNPTSQPSSGNMPTMPPFSPPPPPPDTPTNYSSYGGQSSWGNPGGTPGGMPPTFPPSGGFNTTYNNNNPFGSNDNNTNPFGRATPPSYGAPPTYGTSSSYGAPPPLHGSATPPPTSYRSSTNPFDDSPGGNMQPQSKNTNPFAY